MGRCGGRRAADTRSHRRHLHRHTRMAGSLPGPARKGDLVQGAGARVDVSALLRRCLGEPPVGAAPDQGIMRVVAYMLRSLAGVAAVSVTLASGCGGSTPT